MQLTWGLFHTLAMSLGPGVAARGCRAPSASTPGSQVVGARPAWAEGQLSTGHRAGAALSCPEKLSLSYCYTSPPANTLCHLTKIPSVLLECCSPSVHVPKLCHACWGASWVLG